MRKVPALSMTRFVKMQGLGNDYVYIDCFQETLPESAESLAVKMSDRHTGIGSDGLILIEPSQTCDVKMRMFNSDGSQGAMCGNGIRCVGKYAYDFGLCRKDVITVETASGVKALDLTIENGVCTGARVDMGDAVCGEDDIVLAAASRVWILRKADMGNPHAVCFLDELPDDVTFYAAGPQLEKDPVFPNNANIEFCKALSKSHIKLRVWERGSGETMACGTGACAGVAVGIALGILEKKCVVTMPGGDLTVEKSCDGHMYMTGPAKLSFTGVWPE